MNIVCVSDLLFHMSSSNALMKQSTPFLQGVMSESEQHIPLIVALRKQR